MKNINENTKKTMIENMALATIILVVWFVCFSHTVAGSNSMYPLIKPGDHQLYFKLTKNFKRGDIILFNHEDEINLGKRIIGLPGDEISFHDGYVLINSKILDESKYLDENTETNCIETFIVPENAYFVLGDNRENSFDSRFYATPFVTNEEIIGKLIVNIPLGTN